MLKLILCLFAMLLCSCVSSHNVKYKLANTYNSANIIYENNKLLNCLAFHEYFRVVEENKTPVYEVYLGGNVFFVEFDTDNDGIYDIRCLYNDKGEIKEPPYYYSHKESTLYDRLVLFKFLKYERSPFIEPFVNTKQQTVVRNSKSYLEYLGHLRNLTPFKIINAEDIYESITDREIKENIKVIDVEKDFVDIE